MQNNSIYIVEVTRTAITSAYCVALCQMDEANNKKEVKKIVLLPRRGAYFVMYVPLCDGSA